MKNIHFKHSIVSAIMVWILGILTFVSSYLIPVLPDPDKQANIVLSIGLIPIVIFGAFLYYRRGHQTNGFKLGLVMFAFAIILDALFTVPLLIIPQGGTYQSFFLDPGFWLIGLEYIIVVACYWKIAANRKLQNLNTGQA